MKNKTLKRNQSNKTNKTRKSDDYIASGGRFSPSDFFKKNDDETPFKKVDENKNLDDLKTIISGLYYGYIFMDNNTKRYNENYGLPEDLKENIDVAIITMIGDAYEINYLASDLDIEKENIIISENNYFIADNIPDNKSNNTKQALLDNFKMDIKHIYNGFKAPKKEKSRRFPYKSKFIKIKERENIKIAIIEKVNEKYNIEFLKEKKYEEGKPRSRNNGNTEKWEIILTEKEPKNKLNISQLEDIRNLVEKVKAQRQQEAKANQSKIQRPSPPPIPIGVAPANPNVSPGNYGPIQKNNSPEAEAAQRRKRPPPPPIPTGKAPAKSPEASNQE